ncbi:MAG: hypothetical protein GY797_07830 [Deltaproteobacteria bacterium]|nr:hypothetical protein [Deltaproteobacteria bacterium]
MKKTRGADFREAGLTMAFKLLLQAESRWRNVNAPHLLSLVQKGMVFPDDKTKLLADMSAKVDQHVDINLGN